MSRQPGCYRRRTLWVLALAAGYRLVWINWFGPGPDEASYWDWSRHLDYGYVDHPPLIAFAYRLLCMLFGDEVWPWRLAACTLSIVSAWLLFCAARTLFGERTGFWTVVALSVSPVYSMAGGLLLVPETLLVLWVCLAVYLSARWLQSADPRWLYLIGVVFGLAMLSKYPAPLIPGALALFALCSARHRQWFRRKEPYLMVLIGLLMFAPVILWNARHDWVGVTFMARRSSAELEHIQPGPELLWSSVTAQAGYHSPGLFVLLWVGLGAALYRALAKRDQRYLLLVCYSAPVMILFQVAAAFRYTLPHWCASGYITSYLLLAAVATDHRPPWPRVQKALAGGALGLGVLICLALPLLLMYPLTTVAYRHLQSVVHSPETVVDPMAQSTGWTTEIRDAIGRHRAQLAQETGTEPVVLTHLNVQAGLLSYALRKECAVWANSWDAYQYRLWFDETAFENRPVLFVRSDAFPLPSTLSGRPEEFYRFEDCRQRETILITRHDIAINRVYLWACTGFLGPVDPFEGEGLRPVAALSRASS